MSLRRGVAIGSFAGWARTHQYQLILLVFFVSSVAIFTPFASARHRERLLKRWRWLLKHAVTLTLGGSRLLNEPARAVRGYIDESAGRVYSILVRQFDLQLDRLVDAALRQAKSVLIDPDMPHGVSSLISDTLERIGPELSQAIRKQADVAILRPIARRLQPDGWQGPRTAPSSRTPHHMGATLSAVSGRAILGQSPGPGLGHLSNVPTFPAYRSPRPALLRRSIRTPCAVVHETAHIVIVCLMTLARWSAAVICAARAHVLYTLQPFDRSMWSCFRDPQYWLFTALGATPLPSWLPAAWWFLVFAWQDGTDEHQVASFIVGLESASASCLGACPVRASPTLFVSPLAEFALTGCWGLIIGSARQFICSALPLTFPCETYGPRLSVLDALLFFSQLALVWRAFHVLRSLPPPSPSPRVYQRDRRSSARHPHRGTVRPALHRVEPLIDVRPPEQPVSTTCAATPASSVINGPPLFLRPSALRPARHPTMSSLRSPPWLSPILNRVLALQPSTEIGTLLQADGSPRVEQAVATLSFTHLDGADPRRLFQVPSTPGAVPRSHLNGLCDDLRSVVSPRRPHVAQRETLHGHAEHRNVEDTWPASRSDLTSYEPGTDAFGMQSTPSTLNTPDASHEFITVSSNPLSCAACSRSACSSCSLSGVLSASRRGSLRVVRACTTTPRCLWRYTTRTWGSLTSHNLLYAATSLGRPPCGRRRPGGGGGSGRAESTLGGAADEFLRRGGALQLLYWYNAVAVALCCILAFLALCVEVWRALDAACSSSARINGGGFDVTLDGDRAFSALSPYLAPWCGALRSSSAASPKLPPLFWPSLFWLRTLYGLSGAPYVAFKLPLVARLYLTPHATGYDRQGRTVLQRLELRGRATPPRDEEQPHEPLGPEAAVA